MRTSLTLALGAIGAVAAAIGPAAAADNLGSVVRELNQILNPDDARRMEEQARRNHRIEEERYWHNYGAGLEQQRRGPGSGAGPQYGRRIDADEARRLEAQARRNGRFEEERYWHNYLAGLEAPRPGPREEVAPRGREDRITADEARRLEDRARREGHWDEARYWAAYRSGLERR
jgi:hypothetical protein